MADEISNSESPTAATNSQPSKSHRIFIGFIIFVVVIVGIYIIGALSSSTLNRGSSSLGRSPGLDMTSSGSGISSLSPISASPSSISMEKSSSLGRSSDSSSSSSSEKRIQKGGSLSLVVDNVDRAKDQAKTTATSLGGELVTSYQSNPDNPTVTMTLKVPVAKFDSALTSFRKIASRVSSESVSLEDVTEQYSDYQAQMKNLKATEEQYVTIMKQAKTVEEILQVQQQLSITRGQIEQLQAQINYLERQTDMATFTLYIATDEENLPVLSPVNKWKPITVFKSALRALINFLKAFSYLIIWLVVFAIIWIPIWLIIRWYRKAHPKKFPQ